MARDEGYRRYLEAAVALGEITRARAEEVVRELMSTGDAQRAKGQEFVDEVMDRSRKAAGDLLDLVRTEVANQLQALGLDPDELGRQAADFMRRSAEAGRRVVKDAVPAGAGGAKKAASKKAAGGAKKAAGAKKATPKKAASAKKTSGAKKTTSKKETSKKAAAKKATGKKSS